MTAPEKTQGKSWPVGSVWQRFDAPTSPPRIVVQHTASGLLFAEAYDWSSVKWVSYKTWKLYAMVATRTDEGGNK